jgi:hypothetical protein
LVRFPSTLATMSATVSRPRPRAAPSTTSPTRKVTTSSSWYSNVPWWSVNPEQVGVTYRRPTTGPAKFPLRLIAVRRTLRGRPCCSRSHRSRSALSLSCRLRSNDGTPRPGMLLLAGPGPAEWSWLLAQQMSRTNRPYPASSWRPCQGVLDVTAAANSRPAVRANEAGQPGNSLSSDWAQPGWRCASAACCAAATSPARMASTSSRWTFIRCCM